MVRFILAFLFFGFLVSPSVSAEAPAKLKVACGSNGIELELCRKGIDAWSKKTKIPVEVFSTPNESNDRLSLYQQLMGAKSPDVDLYQIDVIWPGSLAPHLLDITASVSEAEKKEFIPGVFQNGYVNNKLVALPWFTDGGVLYYRKDLLTQYAEKVPETWEQLKKVSEKIMAAEKAKNKELWGYVFQGKAYEGLTCNAVEWVTSYGGGKIVEADGRFSLNNPQAKEALLQWSDFVGTLAPKGVLSYSEEEARGVFQSEKAIFMRNWPYVWALVNADASPLKGKVGMAPLPTGTPGGHHASTLGGWYLGVSAYSKYPKEAIELAKFLTGYDQQKMRSIDGAFNPTRVALYEDKEVLKKNPHLKELKAVFLAAAARPASVTGRKYNRLSSDLWNAVHQVLEGKTKPEEALNVLEKRVASYGGPGKW